MKSSQFTLAALALTLAFGTAAYAKGPMNGQAGSTSAGAGVQSRAGNPGVGTATRTQLQDGTQLQAEAQIRSRLQTMSADGVAGTGAAVGTGAPRGIHSPGTGLTTTTTDSTAVAQ
jgi:hypothetical protein